jgi:hypothetical protein
VQSKKSGVHDVVEKFGYLLARDGTVLAAVRKDVISNDTKKGCSIIEKQPGKMRGQFHGLVKIKITKLHFLQLRAKKISLEEHQAQFTRGRNH